MSTISGSDGAYDTDELRKALQERGYPLGPITGNTKRVYLRRLKRLRRRPEPPPTSNQPGETFHFASLHNIPVVMMSPTLSHRYDLLSLTNLPLWTHLRLTTATLQPRNKSNSPTLLYVVYVLYVLYLCVLTCPLLLFV